MSRIIRGRYRNVKRSRYRTAPYKWDFRNRSWDVGRRPIKGPDRMTLLNAGVSATFTGDAASADGWHFNTADDTLWIGDTTTGIRLTSNGGTSAGFKIQTIEYDPSVLLRVTGSACTRFACHNSPTDIVGELDILALTNLTYLNIGNNPSITAVDISTLTNLTIVYISSDSNISELAISGLTLLEILYMYGTGVTSVAANAFDNLDALTKVHWYNCSLSTAVVDQCIMDFHGDRAAKVAMLELKLAGTNSVCTGTYQAPAIAGSPANAAEAAWELVNVEGWTVEVNTA